MTATVDTVPDNRLEPIGAPILPGGTEAHIRKMIAGNLYIADVEGHGLLAASPHWIVPAGTVEPIMTAAGLELEPGAYTVYPTGRSKEPKVHRLESDVPVAMIGRHMDAALAATGPIGHRTYRGLPLLAASWDNVHGGEDWSYVTDIDGLGLRQPYLNWLVGKATPEHRADDGRHRIDEGVYRIRAISDATQPVAVWIERYLNIRHISATGTKSVARRTCYVLMPVRFPADG